MGSSVSLGPVAEVLLTLLCGACVLGIAPALAIRGGEPRGKVASWVAALHPLALLGLFYSLALHMHHRLGGWPDTIGMRGFPDGLVVHADAAMMAFGSLVLGVFVALPAGLLLCGLVPRLRAGLRPLGVYAVTSGLALGLMALAPGSFLSWWWD